MSCSSKADFTVEDPHQGKMGGENKLLAVILKISHKGFAGYSYSYYPASTSLIPTG